MFYQIQYKPKGNSWFWLRGDSVDWQTDYVKAHQALQDWRATVPNWEYRLVTCEVLDD
tara:strand:+ start:115 stop:288 length:174 start_codon:yes stop_codon:yes gene_type:complete